MKRFGLIAVSLCALLLTSCLETSENYTPSVSVSYFVSSEGDTLAWHYYANDDYYYLDSVSVGDTVFFSVGFMSYANMLVSCDISWDSTILDLRPMLAADFIKALSSQSDTTVCHYAFKEGYNGAYVPVRFVPIRSRDTRLTFSVTSDAEQVSNTDKMSVWVYVR